MDGLGCCGDGPDVVGNGWEGLRVTEGGSLYIFFSGFAIDRSKKHIKVIENYIKIDAVDPWAAADNHPPAPQTPANIAGLAGYLFNLCVFLVLCIARSTPSRSSHKSGMSSRRSCVGFAPL